MLEEQTKRHAEHKIIIKYNVYQMLGMNRAKKTVKLKTVHPVLCISYRLVGNREY
jgi:hypothetical protein